MSKSSTEERASFMRCTACCAVLLEAYDTSNKDIGLGNHSPMAFTINGKIGTAFSFKKVWITRDAVPNCIISFVQHVAGVLGTYVNLDVLY